ncbi:MAG: chromate transporter [Eubacteriales bacterium]|nr:chromate transporter [bacterium]MDY2792930.1 chromate transporter [Eubacteriales bacterium]
MNKKLGQLFWTFLKIGAFTFGGGYAMIALLENEFIARRGWLEQDEFLDMVAIAESTPGPVAINSATYIGYRLGRVPGAIVSTVAVSLPSFAIIYLISLFFDRFLSLTYVARAFRGIQVCVVYLIFSAGVRMLKSLPKDGLSRAILAGVFVLSAAFSLCAVRFSSVFFILIGGMIGLAAWGVRARLGKGGEEK